MKKKIILTVCACVAVAALFTPVRLGIHYYLSDCPATGPERQTAFQPYIASVDPAQFKVELQMFADIAKVSVAETIRYTARDYEIYRIDVPGDTSKRDPGKRLLILSAVHGDESVSALVVLDVLRDIRQNPSLYRDWTIRILTPLNPVGLAFGSRYNEQGCDVNRDFKTFATKSATVQRVAVEEFQPSVVLSLHEGPQDGFFVIAEDSVSTELGNRVTLRLREARVPLAQRSFLGLPLSDEGMWHKPQAIYAVQAVFRINTFGQYARDLGLPTLTTESSWTGHDLGARALPHLIVVKAIVESVQKE